MKTIIELLKNCNVRVGISAGNAWLVWNNGEEKWEVYYRRPRQHRATRIISTRSEDAAVAAFMRSAGIAIEEEEEESSNPLVKCRICRKTWPISEMNTNGECPDCQLEEWERRENAPLVKPRGKCVTLTAHDGVKWDV